MKAMLFAAGLGTRLKPFTDSTPKALAPVNNKTLLEHNIRYLQRHGIYDVVVNVHHFADKIETTLKDNNNFGSNVFISDERDEILETGGGLKKAANYFTGEGAFVVMNVDALTTLDLGRMIQAHKTSGAIGTLAVMQRTSGRQFLFDKEMTLCGWQNNNTNEQRISREATSLQPFAFTGIQVLSGTVLPNIPFSGKFSLVDLYLHLAKTYILKGYDHTGDIFIDVGKPESLAIAESLFP
ncbi:MAG: nucleotidyltransferase [Flavipsychrobacter sp.]|jgi:NDP-sugar pyrophosphorylase family protein|nr:nucleotidyltransferase [Flavipsychrobacter sp.]